MTKGLFKRNKGNKGTGRLSDYTPAKVKKALQRMLKEGIKGDHPQTAEYVAEMLTKQWGSPEKGVEGMAKNVRLVTTTVPSWAPKRSDMPVINEPDLAKAKKALERGKIDHNNPHFDK